MNSGRPDGFSPYVLYRRGTLALPMLQGLVPTRTWALLDRATTTEHSGSRARLGEELHRLVPDLAPADRRAVLALRRDVHNGRRPDLSVAGLLPRHCRDLLVEWVQELRSVDELRAEALAAFTAELRTARLTLAAVARHEHFQRGVQLSGEDVYREMMSYAAEPFARSGKPSRRRRVESTITSFAYRVVFKPSPFGSFTEIGAQPWDPRTVPAAGPPDSRGAPAAGPPDSRTAVGPPDSRTAVSRISVGLLAWLVHRVGHLERAEEVMRVRLNNSLVVRDGRVAWIRRAPDGGDDTTRQEQVVDARRTPLVDLLVDALGRGEASERELCDRLVDAGLARPAASRTLHQLVQAGLCHRSLGLPDQTTGYAAEVARRLRQMDTAQARECVEIFERVQKIEDGYAGAAARRRSDLLAELRELVRRLARVCGVPPPPPQALRTIMYEDVGTRSPARTWRPAVVAANRDAITLFQRILPILDDVTIEKLGLYRFFVERFGLTPVGFVDVFRAFAELPASAAVEVMSGVDDAFSAQVRKLRQEFFAMLRGLLDRHGKTGEVRLDPMVLAAFADAVPPFVAPWRSVAYRMQFSTTPERVLAVVNGVTTGHGVFFSRFCDLLAPADPHGWNLADELRAHIARTAGRQTDITAVLGLNFNLHPRLTPLELVYPGSVARTGAPGVLGLADVVVRPDPSTRRLVLVSTVDDQPLDLVPMNFLYPAAAPVLYRFLCAFAPTRTYRDGLWAQLDRHDGGTGAGVRPRVLLGGLVLDRRSWRFGGADLPTMDKLDRQHLPAIVEFDRWRVAQGLPRHTFFRILSRLTVTGGEPDPLDEARRWALESRSARLHKPHYLDARNPFLLAVLARQIRELGDGVLVFHECLPGPEQYRIEGGTAGAEEFFVEFTKEAGEHG